MAEDLEISHSAVAQLPPVDKLSVAKVSDTDKILDDLLSRWHWWAKGEKQTKGFNRKAVLIGDVRPWHLQYDGQLEQAQAQAESHTMYIVDCNVWELGDPHRTAIYMDARNLCTGLAVWFSPRLPKGVAERESLLKAARRALVRKLKVAGIME